MKTLENEYFPDLVSSPGEALEDVLENVSLTQKELADRMGRPIKTVNEIIKNKTLITPETAIQLEKVLGVPSDFWLQREANYRNFLAKRRELISLKKYVPWLAKFPIRKMVEYGFIDDPGTEKALKVDSLLKFFGVASPKQWENSFNQMELSFKRSTVFNAHMKPTTVWLRMGEILAKQSDLPPYNKEKFQENLVKIKKLIPEKDVVKFKDELIKLCGEAGVVLVFVPALPGVPVSGVARWLTPTKPLIQLSLRHKTDDHLWFAFFHEVCHLLKHKKKCVYVEINGKGEKSEIEDEADSFSRNFLISPEAWSSFVKKGIFSDSSIIKFASENTVSPGIVVGRLQHDNLVPYASNLNNLKVRFKWIRRDS